MHDELRQRDVERAVCERQLLGDALADVDAGMAHTHRIDELRGWVDRRDRSRTEPGDELGRERARPAADVERPLPGGHIREVGELRRRA